MNTLPVKACSKCKESKPYSDFHTDRSKSNGIKSQCKKCFLERDRLRPRYKAVRLSTKKAKALPQNQTVKRKARISLFEKGLIECVHCKNIQPLRAFNTSKKSSTGRKSICKPCEIKYQKSWHVNLGVDHKRYIYNHLESNPCIDCGESNPMKLEFDHFRDKAFNISQAIIKRKTLDQLKNEIKKCVVRCSSCHTAKTHKEQDTWKYQMYLERNK
jgi:hypothetical protein